MKKIFIFLLFLNVNNYLFCGKKMGTFKCNDGTDTKIPIDGVHYSNAEDFCKSHGGLLYGGLL